MINDSERKRAKDGEPEKSSGRASFAFLLHAIFVIPPFLLQASLITKTLITFAYLLLCVAFGRKPRVFLSFITFLGIVFVHLFIPIGKLLFTVASFPVTLGALLIGAEKGLNVVGLIYISQFSLSEYPVIPGRIGNIVTKTFRFLGKMVEKKPKVAIEIPEKGFSIKRFSGRIDDFLLTIWKSGSADSQSSLRSKRKIYLPILLFLIILIWALFFVPI